MSRSISIEHLNKSFTLKDGSALKVLEQVSLTAAENEFCALLGPSGCGKSTILNILSKLIPADSGTIRIGDRLLAEANANMGYIFQKARLLNWKTVRENIRFALKTMGVPRGEWDDRVRHYVKLVGLEQFIDEYPLSLSGGMQQRVSIARALAIGPQVLLMDEPFSSLDELTARGLRRELLRIWSEERNTILFVTHNALEAVFLADRIYLFSPRPTTVIRDIKVTIPRPRELEDPNVFKLQKEVVTALGVL